MAADPDRIEQRVYVKATPARVWRAFAAQEQFEAWFEVKLDGPLIAGAANHMADPNEPATWERFSFEVIEMRENERIVWKWHPGMHEPGEDRSAEPRTQVSVSLVPHLDGTMVTIEESGFSGLPPHRLAAIMRDNVDGWLVQASKLKDYVNDAD